ncbi:MAG: Maf family protein [Proteobacteria bacterium]|nr:Maf family protein [Pseudomonadota bacterium]
MIYTNCDYPLYLLSSSPRRSELLKSLGINFEVIKPFGEEITFKFKSPRYYAEKKALNKLLTTLEKLSLKNGAFISADTIVVRKKKIYEKPGDEKEAISILKALEGKWHTVFTAYCIAVPSKNIQIVKSVRTQVKFKRMKMQEIENYVKTGEPLDKAGAYAVQGHGLFMIEKIEGSYTNVVGLPLVEVITDLLKLNIIKPK